MSLYDDVLPGKGGKRGVAGRGWAKNTSKFVPTALKAKPRPVPGHGITDAASSAEAEAATAARHASAIAAASDHLGHGPSGDPDVEELWAGIPALPHGPEAGDAGEYDPLVPTSYDAVLAERSRRAERAEAAFLSRVRRRADELAASRPQDLAEAVHVVMTGGMVPYERPPAGEAALGGDGATGGSDTGGAGSGGLRPGSGRRRRTSLPAWVVQQQREAGQGQGAGGGSSSSSGGAAGAPAWASSGGPAAQGLAFGAAAVGAAGPRPADGFAARLMASMGYRPGQGLGKRGDGMTSALRHVATGQSRGVIVELGKHGAARAAGAMARGGGGAATGGGGGKGSRKRQRGAQPAPTFLPASTAAPAGGLADRPPDLRPEATAAAFAGAGPGCVVFFRNLAEPADATAELVEDFCEGCGGVAPVLGARLRQDAARGAEAARERVGVEVVFASAQDAARAAALLATKRFDDRPVIADLVGQD